MFAFVPSHSTVLHVGLCAVNHKWKGPEGAVKACVKSRVLVHNPNYVECFYILVKHPNVLYIRSNYRFAFLSYSTTTEDNFRHVIFYAIKLKFMQKGEAMWDQKRSL